MLFENASTAARECSAGSARNIYLRAKNAAPRQWVANKSRPTGGAFDTHIRLPLEIPSYAQVPSRPSRPQSA